MDEMVDSLKFAKTKDIYLDYQTEDLF